MSDIIVNNYQTKPFLSYNMRFLRYVRQCVQTAMAEDVSAVKGRSIYYYNLILRVLLFSFTRTLKFGVVQQKRQST